MTDFTRRGFFRAVGGLLPKVAAVAIIAHGVAKSKPAQASTIDNLPKGEWTPDEARGFYAVSSVASEPLLYRRED